MEGWKRREHREKERDRGKEGGREEQKKEKEEGERERENKTASIFEDILAENFLKMNEDSKLQI